MRRVASSNEFFDILDKIGNGKFVTIGYVTGANLDVPKISKKNPLTNRMKQYPDYTVFGNEEGEIGALVKISSYNMRYLNRATVGKKYGEYKDSANNIRGSFGLDPIGTKQGYKQGTSWSPNGPELYNGQNSDLQSHSYNPQNIYGVKPNGIVYAVNKEGHIIKALKQEQVVPYLKAKREIDGVAALRKMGMEEEKIQEYIKQINDLKFKYINFESNSILWIAATINGEKIVYINDNLSRIVDDINISPEDFRAIARERYQVDLNNLQEMTNKKVLFRLTESELKAFLNESVRSVLSELDWKTYANASKKRDAWVKDHPNHRANKWNRFHDFENAATDSFNRQYGLKNQYDNGAYGGEVGTINLNPWDDKYQVTGSRNHDFGDGDPHGLRHNVYHMGKRYGKDGGYGRTRMWDVAHETTPEEFYGNDELGKKFRAAEKDAEDYESGKSHYVSGKGWSNENTVKESKFGKGGNGVIKGDIYGTKLSKDGSKYARELMKQHGIESVEEEGRSFRNNQGYSHFAVNKVTNKIVNGWDYKGYDPNELRQFKKDYFDVDLVDYDLDPKQYKIVSGKFLLRQGIDPNDNNNWANS